MSSKTARVVGMLVNTVSVLRVSSAILEIFKKRSAMYVLANCYTTSSGISYLSGTFIKINYFLGVLGSF